MPVETADDGLVEIHTEDELRVLHDLTGWALEGGHALPGPVGAARLARGHLSRADEAGRVSPVSDPGVTTRRRRRRRDGPVGAGAGQGVVPGLSDAGLVARQVGFEQLSFWLNPIGAVMTIGFSVVFLDPPRLDAGSRPSSYLAHIKLIEYYVPGFCTYGVMAACFTILAITLVNRRETGLLKRLRLSPLPTWMLLAAIFVNSMIVAAIQIVLLLVVGWLGYGVSGPAHWAPFVVTLLVAMVCYSAMGVGISTLVPNRMPPGRS